jgi:hypothetical protein
MTIQLIENLMPVAFQNTVEKILLGDEFPLYINKETVLFEQGKDNYGIYYDKNSKDCPQFTHAVVRNGHQSSEYWSVLRPILYQAIASFNVELEIVRCKVNVNFPSKSMLDNEYYPPHQDTEDAEQCVGIYYVNDSDGDTLFFETPEQNIIDGEFKVIKQITPKKGSFVLFPSNTVHAGSPPKLSDLRCVINFNFKMIRNKNA